MPGVDHSQIQTMPLQGRIGTLPINPCAFDHHQFRLKRRYPGRHFTPISFKAAKLAHFGDDLAQVVFIQDTDGQLGLVYIQRRHTTIDCG